MVKQLWVYLINKSTICKKVEKKWFSQIRKKVESVDFWEFDERRRGNLLNDSHDWCLVISQMKESVSNWTPPPPLQMHVSQLR